MWILAWMFDITELFFLLLNRCYNICISTTKGDYYANTIIATWGYFSFWDVITSNISLPSNSFNKKNILPSSTLAPTSQNHNLNSLFLSILLESDVDKLCKTMKTNSKALKTLLLFNYLRKKRLTTIHGNILQVCKNDHSSHTNQSNFVSCLSYQCTWMDLRNGY